jgi:hypothetical protein
MWLTAAQHRDAAERLLADAERLTLAPITLMSPHGVQDRYITVTSMAAWASAHAALAGIPDDGPRSCRCASVDRPAEQMPRTQ